MTNPQSKPNAFDQTEYFTDVTKGRGRDLKYLKNMLISSGTENELIEEEAGTLPIHDQERYPSVSEHYRIFIKVGNQVFVFDHTTAGEQIGLDPINYAIDLDHQAPRIDRKASFHFYPDMAEIWCCQNSFGQRRILKLDVRDEGEESPLEGTVETTSKIDSETEEPTNRNGYEEDVEEEGACCDQFVTFLIPDVSPKGNILHIRIKTTDMRIPGWLAMEELEVIVEWPRPAEELVWLGARDGLTQYCEDKDVAKDVKRRLETALLIAAQRLCAVHRSQERFFIDLTQDKYPGSLDSRSPAVEVAGEFDGEWRHIDHFDMSGDFRWTSLEPVETSIVDGTKVRSEGMADD